MINKVKNILVYMFCAFFAICFSYLLANILLKNSEYNYKKMTLTVFIVISVSLLAFIYTRLSKHEAFFIKHYKPILAAFLSIMLILQISFGLLLRFKPDFDMDSVYQGAIDWVQTGSFTNYYNYYYYFPNNLGSMGFLHFFFKIASFFGIKDFFLVGMLLNSLLSISMMFVVFQICKRVLGVKQAVFSLLLFAVSLPFYFIAPVFYTDALSMFFPVLFYYLYLIWKDTSELKRRCLLCFWMGIAASIGMEIKFTVVVMVIAVTIDMFFNVSWKKSILTNVGIYAIILVCFAGFNGYIYTYHLDKEQARLQNDPYTHWVMMGLKGTGGYNPDDYNFTRSFSDPDERRKATIEEIKNRVKDYGADGMFKFLTQKGVKCLGDGTLGFDDFLADRPDRNFLHKYILSDGEKYDLYRHICEAVLFTIMFFMIFPALQFIFGKEKYSANKKSLTPNSGKGENDYINLAPMLAVFGILLFLLAWEANRRYFSNFIPVFIICATLGIDYFCVLMSQFAELIKFGINKISKNSSIAK
ncbi:glycosyltransferase family 39 protein [Acetivibrio cellulolyticus]|uniref:glycosyltransferase family 39 protein n=1 Tax=Acetivibrio cellulolyticus TaxID=35830 RepID=UPI0001E2EB63|nr:glycosyltransferase family 39 protein [Acetivibrio cellulolyticus]